MRKRRRGRIGLDTPQAVALVEPVAQWSSPWTPWTLDTLSWDSMHGFPVLVPKNAESDWGIGSSFRSLVVASFQQQQQRPYGRLQQYCRSSAGVQLHPRVLVGCPSEHYAWSTLSPLYCSRMVECSAPLRSPPDLTLAVGQQLAKSHRVVYNVQIYIGNDSETSL